MNVLFVGADKSEITHDLPDRFLFIDDGEYIEQLPPQKRRGTYLDLTLHSFNPLKDIDYKRARDFLSVLNSIFPEGENTLTRKSSNLALLKAFLSGAPRLDKLFGDVKDNGELDAKQKIETLLLSPVLEKFLLCPRNIPLDGILIAKLDRKVLSDFDAFVIANVLISNYQGHVVVPDFGFYACPFHTSLIRQNRLTAGVNFLDEAPKMRNSLLLMQQKFARKATAEDAKVIASYYGLVPGTNEHTDFIQKSIA